MVTVYVSRELVIASNKLTKSLRQVLIYIYIYFFFIYLQKYIFVESHAPCPPSRTIFKLREKRSTKLFLQKKSRQVSSGCLKTRNFFSEMIPFQKSERVREDTHKKLYFLVVEPQRSGYTPPPRP